MWSKKKNETQINWCVHEWGYVMVNINVKSRTTKCTCETNFDIFWDNLSKTFKCVENETNENRFLLVNVHWTSHTIHVGEMENPKFFIAKKTIPTVGLIQREVKLILQKHKQK